MDRDRKKNVQILPHVWVDLNMAGENLGIIIINNKNTEKNTFLFIESHIIITSEPFYNFITLVIGLMDFMPWVGRIWTSDLRRICSNAPCVQFSARSPLRGPLKTLNPLTAKIFDLNFHPLEIASRWRDPQLQVSKNYSNLTKWRSTVFKYCWLMSYSIFTMFKGWYLMC